MGFLFSVLDVKIFFHTWRPPYFIVSIKVLIERPDLKQTISKQMCNISCFSKHSVESIIIIELSALMFWTFISCMLLFKAFSETPESYRHVWNWLKQKKHFTKCPIFENAYFMYMLIRMFYIGYIAPFWDV